MLSISTTGSQKRAWFQGGYRTSIQATLRAHTQLSNSSSRIPVASLFERILSAAPNGLFILERAEVRSENGQQIHVVENIRGRSLPSQGGTNEARSREEVFFSSGTVTPPPITKNGESKQEETIPFEFALHTEFSKFENTTIEHKLVGNSSSILHPAVDEFEIHLIPKLIPANVQQIRFGIEHFRRTFAGGLAALLGPSVFQKCYIDITERELSVTIEQEYGGVAGEIPQFDGNIIGPLDYALDSLELFVGLGRHLEESISNKR